MAVLTIAVAQVAMVAIMGISTIDYRQQGMSLAVISFVLSGHFSGMFAFSPVWGAFLDRRGRKEGLLSAGALTAAGVILTSRASWSCLAMRSTHGQT